MTAQTVEKNALGKIIHDCRALGCDVALNGIALVDVEIYVARTGEVVQIVLKGLPMPKRSAMLTLSKTDRPFTRRKVA